MWLHILEDTTQLQTVNMTLLPKEREVDELVRICDQRQGYISLLKTTANNCLSQLEDEYMTIDS